jgi:hypothetical protein
MPQFNWLTAATFVSVAFSCWSIVSISSQRKRFPKLRDEGLARFRAAEAQSGTAELRFRGASARIVRQEETGGVVGVFSKGTNYSLTVYALNEQGEYFMFKFLPPSGEFLKHISHEAAKAVLKKNYVSPVG